MKETKVKRDNLSQLAEALKQLLGDEPFTFSYQDRRRSDKDAARPEKKFEQSTLFGDNPICSWIRDQDDKCKRKSTLRVAVQLPSGAIKFLDIHPSVRCGGKRYDDNGHRSWFKSRPGKIEIRDGHNNTHCTFQTA